MTNKYDNLRLNVILDQEDWETEYICIQEKDKKIK